MAKIYYTEVDDFIRKEERYELLRKAKNVYGVEWQEITPDKNHTWLTEGLDNDFDKLMPMGTKEAKAAYRGSGGEGLGAIFGLYSNGVKTNKDVWTFNFQQTSLIANINQMIDYYNELVNKSKLNRTITDKDFYNDKMISWSENLLSDYRNQRILEFDTNSIRDSLYRPFCKQFLYFNKNIVERRYQYHRILPTKINEEENIIICVSGLASNKPFHCLAVKVIPELSLVSTSQCFPFYTYNEDGTGRKENISDWALTEYRNHYNDTSISKWDIFYYIYGVLHNPEYREKYSANLRRSLPRIPYYSDFWKYSNAGKQLAELHVNYEKQPEYYLQKIEKEGEKLNWKVEKMRLSKDKQSIIYNDFLTLSGIPAEVFEYKLGNRSALEWLIDQYRIKTDKRSGIINDPNRADEPDYILKLIGKIITVSIETVRIVKEMGE